MKVRNGKARNTIESILICIHLYKCVGNNAIKKKLKEKRRKDFMPEGELKAINFITTVNYFHVCVY